MKSGMKRAKFSITMKPFVRLRLIIVKKEEKLGTQKHPVQNADFLVRTLSKIFIESQKAQISCVISEFLAVPPPPTLIFNSLTLLPLCAKCVTDGDYCAFLLCLFPIYLSRTFRTCLETYRHKAQLVLESSLQCTI